VTTTLYNQQRDLPISAASVEKLISFLFKTLKIKSDEIILHFVTKQKISQAHKIYFNDPTPTDCISFPLDSPRSQHCGHHILGEILICPKVAIEYGKKNGIDAYEEATRYIVHGLLHLIGLDDMIPEERAKMQAKENRCMKLLRDQGILIHG
jgi:probable rRNA maturation factor